jgi:hypothetical protein
MGSGGVRGGYFSVLFPSVSFVFPREAKAFTDYKRLQVELLEAH